MLTRGMEVKARAPGKIILSGEHAVVYGSAAVAAAIDLYTYVSITFPPPSRNALAVSLLYLYITFSRTTIFFSNLALFSFSLDYCIIMSNSSSFSFTNLINK